MKIKPHQIVFLCLVLANAIGCFSDGEHDFAYNLGAWLFKVAWIAFLVFGWVWLDGKLFKKREVPDKKQTKPPVE